MTRKSCYKPIKAFIYIEFLAYDEDAMGNLITTNLAFRELENEAVETINVFAGLGVTPSIGITCATTPLLQLVRDTNGMPFFAMVQFTNSKLTPYLASNNWDNFFIIQKSICNIFLYCGNEIILTKSAIVCFHISLCTPLILSTHFLAS